MDLKRKKVGGLLAKGNWIMARLGYFNFMFLFKKNTDFKKQSFVLNTNIMEELFVGSGRQLGLVTLHGICSNKKN